MPIDPTEPATTDATDRRAFLTRTAAGGALAATVATTGFAGLGLGSAGAQGATEPSITEAYAARLAPLELAASVAYEAALSDVSLSAETSSTLRQFQRNHQSAAAWLADHIADGAPEPRADVGVATRFSPSAGADETAAIALLAALEEGLAATHLAAIETFDDTSAAKTVSQILAVQQQQAVVLGRASGESIESLTPATASVDGTLETGGEAPTTTTEPASDDESDESDGSDPDADDSADSTSDADSEDTGD